MAEKKENGKFYIDKNGVCHMTIIKNPKGFTKNEKQEKEITKANKKQEISKKIYNEGTKLAKNNLKKEIVNQNIKNNNNQNIKNTKKIEVKTKNTEKKEIKVKNTDSFDNYLYTNIEELAKSLDISINGLVKLIDRESGFDKNAKSPTGAKGIMQLTNAPLEDMQDLEIGAKNYLNIIKKIPDKTINSIKNKWIKIAFERIKNGDENIYNQNIKEITSRAKNDPYCNFIVGCIHLAKLKSNTNPENSKEKQNIIDNLKKVKKNGIQEVNELLISKNKSPINPKDIDDIIKKLHSNEEYYKNFVSYIKYNGDNKKQGGIAHKYLYAVAIAKAKENLKIS